MVLYLLIFATVYGLGNESSLTRMADSVSRSNGVNRMSWFDLGGAALLRRPAAWSEVEAFLGLFSEIVEGWPKNQVVDFASQIGLTEFLKSDWDRIVKQSDRKWISNNHEKPLPVIPLKRRVYECLARAPLRTLDLIVPLVSTVVKRVVYYEKSVCELIRFNRELPMVAHIENSSDLKILKSPLFPRLVLPDLRHIFKQTFSDPGLDYESGRLLGLMFLRGQTVSIPSSFFHQIADTRRVSYPSARSEHTIASGFWEVVPLKGKIGRLDLELLLTDHAHKMRKTVQYIGSAKTALETSWFWEIVEGEKFPADLLFAKWYEYGMKFGLLSKTGKEAPDMTEIRWIQATKTLLVPKYSTREVLARRLFEFVYK